MTRPVSVAAAIASRLVSRNNCALYGALANATQREWYEKHSAAIQHLVREFLPSGSGLDAPVKFDDAHSAHNVLVFDIEFHHMDENGSYDGWTQHTLRVRPGFNGLDLTLTGRNRNDILTYLLDLFRRALEAEVVCNEDGISYRTVEVAA